MAERVWQEWFIPFLTTIENNRDVIKAIAYINADWPSQPMWITNPVFQQVDARLQVNPEIVRHWQAILDEGRFMVPDPRCWRTLTE